MAAQGHTTGAQSTADEVRRRNVPSQSTTPAVAQAPAVEKSKQKVIALINIGHLSSEIMLTGPALLAFQHPHIPRRIRVHMGSDNIYRTRFFHSHVEDWAITDSHMG
jgi:hypothetical protein